MSGHADSASSPSTFEPPVPPLDPPSPTLTNTLALLLPSLALFDAAVLTLLREHYEAFGPLAHWAPVRAFGRVILVYAREGDAERARHEGDRLRIDLGEGAKDYFGGKPLVLRLYALPPTPLHVDPATTHLAPPVSSTNFLISPPGSPPEGWEPVREDGPNTATLADDLRRALERLQLNGRRRANGGPEVILDEGGVRVEVEDTAADEAKEVVEYVKDDGAWTTPGLGGAIALDGATASSGATTPGGRVRIVPTAMPPRA
ncbi:hypothetical protein Q5752_002247 [Cryptotrichosporon argae]